MARATADSELEDGPRIVLGIGFWTARIGRVGWRSDWNDDSIFAMSGVEDEFRDWRPNLTAAPGHRAVVAIHASRGPGR